LSPALRADDAAEAVRLVNAGRYAEAARLYESLAARDPGNASIHHSLGLCYQSLRDYPRAAASLEQAVRLSPDPAAPAYSLALLDEALALAPAQRRIYLSKAADAWRIVVSRGRGDAAHTAALHLERILDELKGAP
jgi:tetratricopeptide (TPR) repeat protein